MKMQRMFALYGVDHHRFPHMICTIPAADIDEAARAFGGTTKEITGDPAVWGCERMFPLNHLMVRAEFIVGKETATRLAQFEHPDAPEDVLKGLIDTHDWAFAGNCYTKCFIGSVPVGAVESRKEK